ncbi:MAG TPA: UvrD-helicase domain-containing protein, partial [Pirellulaceae bacterium]|nr:UvrD-helicase domain-containing protein [Pirellulaceae bacterium]
MSGTAKRSQRSAISAPVALHQIQQASAGTGKTFALSNRFLRLVALGAPPESILAATFTRKGAGEIMDRVIGRLCHAAGDASAARQLGEFLGIDLNQETARQLLRRMCTGLHRLQIGTIDSFFHRLARVMSLDLGLPLDWDIAEGTSLTPLVRQALAAMLGDQQIVELLQLISPGDADRSIAERALETIGQTYELYRESLPSAWEQELNHPPVRGEDVGAFIARWSDLVIERDKQRNRWLAELEFLSLAAWDDLADSTPLANVNGNNYRYYGAMPENLVEAYRELSTLVARAVRHELGQRTAAAGELAARYARELHPRQVRQGVLRFDDITYLLNGVADVLDGMAQTRLDTRIEHVLLDEFQDTSPSQWRVLAPLVERVTAMGSRGSFYCVGDKKQAIYAWRGGVAEIFDAVESRLAGRLEPCEPLVASRRSAQPIIDTVNRTFANLGAVNEPDESPNRTILDQVQSSFPHHITALTDVPGYVALERVEAIKGDPELTQQEAGRIAVLQRVVEEVCRIHASIPTATVGVLLRSNAHIAWLVHQLQLKQIPA